MTYTEARCYICKRIYDWDNFEESMDHYYFCVDKQREFFNK